MPRLSTGTVLFCALLVCLALVGGADAFGAGNIASTARIEGSNWRHGDIEDTLLQLFITRVGGGRKFSKLDVKRVYFGNWLRDYSQAVDVGTVKYVSAEAVRIILWVLGFLSFGYGTKEFEVTSERLGCYRPEEHIDNPKNYADNIDARQYDRRLRGPVDERVELAIDERTGLKNYIASEDRRIATSSGMVRDLLRRCIDLARKSKRNNNEAEMFEALRLLGTATHCLEDYAAHSNYVELCLIELGERDVFPHVGSRTQLRIQGAQNEVFPLITGTFGGTDFLHSVCGEVSDKVTQSEIEELEGTINEASRNKNLSAIRELLNQIPPGLFGGEDHASKVDEISANAAASQLQNTHISPKEPEEFTRQAIEIQKQIYPALEFHDEIMRSITEAVDQIPVLPDLIDKLQEQVSIFVFSVIAPFILPIIGQIKAEISTGSTEIINSSKNEQHVVFNDDRSTDPTHSMLSKDHFTNILNEPAGKTASQVLKWAVPQIVDCWDNENNDAERTINRIINGLFHHPALRQYGDDGAADCRNQMFGVVEQWWRQKDEREKSDFRDKLSRDGVLNGRNHKEGVHDTGHGCGKPLGFANMSGSGRDNAIAGALYSGLQQGVSDAFGQQSGSGNRPGGAIGQAASDAVGGGAFGSVLGGVLGGVTGSLLGGAFSGSDDKHENFQQSYEQPDGGRTQTYVETAHHPGGRQEPDRYGQAAYSRTEYAGGSTETYRRTEQDGRNPTYGASFEQRVETRRDDEGGGYRRTEQTTYGGTGGQYQTEQRTEYSSSQHYGRKEGSDDEDDYAKKERKRREREEKERRKREKKHHSKKHSDNDDDSEEAEYGSGERRHSREEGRGGYGQQQQYERREEGGRREGSRERHRSRRNSNEEDDDEEPRRHHGRGEGGYGGDRY